MEHSLIVLQKIRCFGKSLPLFFRPLNIKSKLSSTPELFLTFFYRNVNVISVWTVHYHTRSHFKTETFIILRRLVGLAVAVNARTGVAGHKERSSPTLEKHSLKGSSLL